jgi:hypothetical protein
MYKPVSILLLLLVLAALISDILIRSPSVRAQGAPTVYIDEVKEASLGNKTAELTTKGFQVVGFSCDNLRCFVLSK